MFPRGFHQPARMSGSVGLAMLFPFVLCSTKTFARNRGLSRASISCERGATCCYLAQWTSQVEPLQLVLRSGP